MLSIGLTGGIASGKSQVGRFLAERGACVVDADRLAHNAYAPGTEGFDALVAAFGSEIASPSGAIDRARLGALVFGRPEQLARLTAIVWPLTRRLVEAKQREQAAAGAEVFVVEAPLLFEAGWQDLFDQVWYVRSPVDAVRQRLQDRGLTLEEAQRRIEAATNAAAAAAGAHLIIDNDADLPALERKVDSAWDALRRGQGPTDRVERA
jgi:dephospho-CoA kinase